MSVTDGDISPSRGASDGPVRRRRRRGRRGRRSALARVRERFVAQPVWVRWVTGVPAVLLVAVLVLASADLAIGLGRIHPGVQVGPVSVGGMTRSSAAERIVEELEPRLSEPVVVEFEGSEWPIDSETVGARIDPTGYVEEAYRVGRQGSLLRRVRERVALWFSKTVVEPYVLGETSLTATMLDRFDEEVGIEPVDAAVSIEGTTVALTPAVVGLAVEHEQAEREILAAFVSEARSVNLPVKLLPVAVTDEDAQTAFEDTLLMLSGPLELTYEQEEWIVPPTEIASWIGFRAIPFSEPGTSSVPGPEATGTASLETTSVPLSGRMVLEAYLVAEEVSATVVPLTGAVGKEAKDAEFRVRSGTVTIIPSEIGLGVDIDGLTGILERVLRSTGGERHAALVMRSQQPDLTTDEARAMGIEERIATYRTTFSSSNKPRVNNIHTLADALDGTLIPPGGTFSFNGTVGPRTADKGYQEAGTIVDGRLVPTLGGGICQVCTTLFNTVFFSGLPVEERRNHSFYISSYPTGRDATVSWGGPDFKFRNETPDWILIATGFSSSSVTISLYGTDPGFEVEYSTGAWTDVKPHSTKETEDPGLDEGVRVVEEAGVDGRRVVVTRRVYRDGKLVREDTFRSKYNPKQEIVRVGTRPVEPEPTDGSEDGTTSPGD